MSARGAPLRRAESMVVDRPPAPSRRSRRLRWQIIIPVGLLALATGVWLYVRGRGAETPVYRFAAVARGDIEAAVSATGTLGAVTTVQVGTQVSGQISAIYADFNDRVTAGQLIARIDPTVQEQAVRDAEAGLERSQAELAKAESDYARDRSLFESQALTASELAATEFALAASRAGGLVGLGVGYGGAALLGRVTGWSTATPPEAVLIAVGFSAAVGVFFGWYPARKAARLDPIEALRHD